MKLKAVILAGVLSLASSAPAATFLITYTGTISKGFDGTGLFGTRGADLAGLPYKAVYTLTDPKPGAAIFNDGHVGQTHGTFNTNPLTATLTIKGAIQSLDQSGRAYQRNGLNSSEPDEIRHEVLNNFGDDSDLLFHSIVGGNIVSSSDYRQPLSYTVRPGDSASGAFGFFTIFNTRLAVGELAPTTVTIARVVPEPATWAMMIAGFGLVGATMRRRIAVLKARFA